MKCDYCGSENVKPVIEKDGKVYLIECLDDKEGLCKYTTIPQLEECPICKKEFTFLFDPGWKERVICSPCEQKAMKEYLDGPQATQPFYTMKKRLKEVEYENILMVPGRYHRISNYGLSFCGG